MSGSGAGHIDSDLVPTVTGPSRGTGILPPEVGGLIRGVLRGPNVVSQAKQGSPNLGLFFGTNIGGSNMCFDMFYASVEEATF